MHAPLDLAQAVLPGMLERGEGWIVNVSSHSAVHAPGPALRACRASPTIGLYGASKAALNRVTNGLAHELWGRGIRVNTVEPRAAVMSEGAEALAGHVIRDDQNESMEEMVEAVVHLCDCDESSTGRGAREPRSHRRAWAHGDGPRRVGAVGEGVTAPA